MEEQNFSHHEITQLQGDFLMRFTEIVYHVGTLKAKVKDIAILYFQ